MIKENVMIAIVMHPVVVLGIVGKEITERISEGESNNNQKSQI